jgi:DNA polymerase II small subunit
MMAKSELVKSLLGKGILVSEDVLELGEKLVSLPFPSQVLFVNSDVAGLIERNVTDINWKELERFKSMAERAGSDAVYKKFIDCLSVKRDIPVCTEIAKTDVEVVFSYNEPTEKKDVKDFVDYFNVRFKQIESILSGRQELSGLTSIGRVVGKKDRETVAMIGMVNDKASTQNGIMLTLEDQTGLIKVHVSASKKELHYIAKNIVLDEVIGVAGATGDKIVFCTNILLPDVPLSKELKKAPEESYAMFLSDIHVGSKLFLAQKFEKFLAWLNGDAGTEEHKAILPKIKYMFIIGDLVDGVGIYPNQEGELEIKDIFDQYKECASLLSRIPKHITIVACPGNHDAIRLSEPQPVFDRDIAKPLYDIPNLMLVSNPGIVNIGAKDGFSGFDVMLYHGYSFDYYISNVDEIRNNGGYDRADLVMKFLLQRRHLSPSHSATLYIPDGKADPLFISRIPDFFASGHIHKSTVDKYRNVSTICGSCWQATTSFQEKCGHHPEPAQVPLVNLQTRQTKLLRF